LFILDIVLEDHFGIDPKIPDVKIGYAIATIVLSSVGEGNNGVLINVFQMYLFK
jgi:hypothetical protein